MAIQIQLRQGTTTEHNSFTGAVGELTYDTTLKSLVLHDGVTKGGVKIPYLSNGRVPSTMLPTATESVVGASKIATTEIAKAGVNDTDFITPLKLKHGLNATGNAPISACRAWVVFTCVSNVVTILNSMNILSVTRLGTSNFKITYATPMPTANNVPLASGQAVIGSNNQYAMTPAIRNILAESCEVYHHSSAADFPLVTLGVFC